MQSRGLSRKGWLGVVAVVWLVAVGTLCWWVWTAWTPVQRGYVEPEIEAETAHLLPLIRPQIAAVGTDPDGGSRWFHLSPDDMLTWLRPAYPVSVASVTARIAGVATVETMALWLLVVVAIRAAQRAEDRLPPVPEARIPGTR